MKHTDRFYLYAWMNKKAPHKVNFGKKVSKKQNYVSSATSMSFWNAYGRGEMIQYCIYESDDEKIIDAAEWWGLDYGITTHGVDKFYNMQNNAHKGDQSLVTAEIKAAIVAFYENRLTPVEDNTTFSVAENIINAVENGGYPVVHLPVFEIETYERRQARVVTRNVDNEDKIIRRYNENPQRVMDEVTPMTICESSDGTRRIVNGHTRLGAALRCKGWNTLPVCIVNESEFGENATEVSLNIIQAGSYANRRSWVETAENTDDDLLFQMQQTIKLNEFDLSVETGRKYIRDYLTERFHNSAGSRHAASGIVTKIFNQFDKDATNYTVSGNLITYSDADLRTYAYKNYESKGIAVIHATMNRLQHFEGLGYIFNHVSHMKEMPKKLAIIIHARNKQEYALEMKTNKIEALKRVIEFYKQPITVDVLPSFDKE
jgi:hypothetical protein